MHDNDTDNRHQMLNGTYYHLDTPATLVVLLEHWRQQGIRLLFTFGDTATGQVWQDPIADRRGRIGRSTGFQQIPLLVKTSRSLGGCILMDNHILQVQPSRGGKVLYTHIPTYRPELKKA